MNPADSMTTGGRFAGSRETAALLPALLREAARVAAIRNAADTAPAVPRDSDADEAPGAASPPPTAGGLPFEIPDRYVSAAPPEQGQQEEPQPAPEVASETPDVAPPQPFAPPPEAPGPDATADPGRAAAGPVAIEQVGSGADLTLRRARALLSFATERALMPDDALLRRLAAAVGAFEAAPGTASLTELRSAYGAFVRHTYATYGVSGKTLLDSSPGASPGRRLAFWLVALFAFAVLLQAVNWPGLESLAPSLGDSGFKSMARDLSLFVWGALGALVFVAKRVGDALAQSRFDEARLRGIAVRVTLGAVLGAVTVILFGTLVDGALSHPLSENGIAFLAGIGVKVVYGLIEKAIEQVSSRLGLDGGGDAVAAPTAPAPASVLGRRTLEKPAAEPDGQGGDGEREGRHP